MKTIANRLVVFAISAVVLGTVAFAETRMQAEIPFAFHTPTGSLPAGQYAVIDNYAGIRGVVALHNTVSNKWVVTMGIPSDSRGSDKAALTFRCNDGCELIGVQARTNVVAFGGRKSSRAQEAAVIAIPLTVVNGN